MKVAVVTPFHNEDEAVLRNCHGSVLSQTHSATHFLVADGQPHRDISGWAGQHIQLPVRHADGGSTPRAIGAMSALNQGYDAVAFLDADNWYHPTHIEECVNLCIRANVHVAIARRVLVLSTGEECPFDDREAFDRLHADTSCLFIRREAGFLATLWGNIPTDLWPICDRIMFAALKARKVSHAWVDERTVYYRSRWGMHFRAMGKMPPADEHRIDWAAISKTYDRDALSGRFGFDPQFDTSVCFNSYRADPSNQTDFLGKVHFF